MSSKTIYRCFIRSFEHTDKVDGERLDDFQFGFWLNSELELTKGSDCVYWIPPSSVRFIQKIEPEYMTDQKYILSSGQGFYVRTISKHSFFMTSDKSEATSLTLVDAIKIGRDIHESGLTVDIIE